MQLRWVQRSVQPPILDATAVAVAAAAVAVAVAAAVFEPTHPHRSNDELHVSGVPSWAHEAIIFWLRPERSKQMHNFKSSTSSKPLL
eukprot:SAG31_NODE_273_length_18667_cov_3.603619_11_plen_87_part_00